jgi:hypothetical protein
MATYLSNITSTLVTRGWSRDYHLGTFPCWYITCPNALYGSLEEPEIPPGEAATLCLQPNRHYYLLIVVNPRGELGATQVEAWEGQGPTEDGLIGEIPAWTDLDDVLAQARLLYLEWELEQIRDWVKEGGVF